MTGVSKKVAKAIDEMGKGDALEALYQICSAIEETAAREYGRGGRSPYKRLIHDNLKLITRVGLGIPIENLNLGYPLAGVTQQPNGMVSLEDVIYHAVRCGMYHETEPPANLQFAPEYTIHVQNGALTLPSSLVHGLILTVVTSPPNVVEQVDDAQCMCIGNGTLLRINALWGRRNELGWLLESLFVPPRKS